MSRFDEVVADSEDEDELVMEPPAELRPSPVETAEGSVNHTASPIQTANSALQRCVSDISAFSNDIINTAPHKKVTPNSSIVNASADSAAPPPKRRPRPKPAYIGAPGYKGLSEDNPSVIDTSTSLSHPRPSSDIQPASSFVTKAHPTPRPTNKGNVSSTDAPASPSNTSGEPADAAKAVPTEITELYSQDIAERAKMRSGARLSAQKRKQLAPPKMKSGVIELSSDDDDDEMSFVPPAKPKSSKSWQPKSPPARKRAKTSHAWAEASESAPTSNVLPHTSPLPPSDPPLPSTASAPSSDVAAPLDIGSPLSSPLPRPTRVRKRKRMLVLPEPDDDEVYVDASTHIYAPPLPPPVFFADSSSSPAVHVPNEGAAQSDAAPPEDSGSKSKTKTRGRKGKATDDSGVDHTEGPAKSKSKRQKKASREDDDDWEMAQEAATKKRTRKAADDDDDDWDGDAPPKAKRKASAKKGKKGAAAEQAGRAPKVGKGKEKVGMAKELSSKESVEDSDEQRDMLRMPPPKDVPAKSSSCTHASAAADGEADDDTRKKQDTSSANTMDQADADLSGVMEVQDVVAFSPPQSPKKISKRKSAKEDSEHALAGSSKSKGKKRAVVLSDDEEELPSGSGSAKELQRGQNEEQTVCVRQSADEERDKSKENIVPSSSSSMPPPPPPPFRLSSSSRSNSISSKKLTPMSELIRKVNSLPGSPFASPRPTYSPYAKSSKALLRRIAPLHPNRRTPPLPPPRPPQPKKTKKQIELEEKWEMELEESVEGWYCLTDEERASLRRAKRDMELGVED